MKWPWQAPDSSSAAEPTVSTTLRWCGCPSDFTGLNVLNTQIFRERDDRDHPSELIDDVTQVVPVRRFFCHRRLLFCDVPYLERKPSDEAVRLARSPGGQIVEVGR